MKRILDDFQPHHILIDQCKFRIETLKELETLSKRAEKYCGIQFAIDPQEVAIQLWSKMNDQDQLRFERSKNNFGINWAKVKAARARGME